MWGWGMCPAGTAPPGRWSSGTPRRFRRRRGWWTPMGGCGGPCTTATRSTTPNRTCAGHGPAKAGAGTGSSEDGHGQARCSTVQTIARSSGRWSARIAARLGVHTGGQANRRQEQHEGERWDTTVLPLWGRSRACHPVAPWCQPGTQRNEGRSRRPSSQGRIRRSVVRDIAVGDIVRAELDERGELQVQERIQWAGSCTIRIVPLPDGGLEDQRQRILDMFAPLGVDGEGIAVFDLVALNVPDNVDYRPIKTLLRAGYDKGWWDCEEGCIGDRWAETEPQVRP